MRFPPWLSWLILAAACAPGAGRHPSVPQLADSAPGESHGASASGTGGDREVGEGTPCGEPVCWTSTSNPSLEQAEQLIELRRAAATVRSRARALPDAEDRACAGLDQEERDVSPFYHRDDIVSARVLNEKARTGKGTLMRRAGARVQFRAVPGLTAARLRLQIDCQIARALAVGYGMRETSYCPLSLGGIEAEVFVMGNGFAVEIRGEDAQTVEEIVRRVHALEDSRDPLVFVPEYW
jgi:hypothetical protein